MARQTATRPARAPGAKGDEQAGIPTGDPLAGRPGPKPSVDREQVIATARRRFLNMESIDMRSIASELGLGRSTLYRWFGDRDALLGEVIWILTRDALLAAYDRAGGKGAQRLQNALESFNRGVASFEPLLHLLKTDPQRTVSILMEPGGLQGRLIGALKELADHEKRAGAYKPLIETEHIAYLVVQTGMTYLFGTALIEQPPDVEQALAVAGRILHLEATD
jgi:AcrR family transcriptional regulator